jgi:tRNA-dihydrouridine synthase
MMRGEPSPPPPGLADLERVIGTHLADIESFYGDKKALHAAKGHIFKYLRGLPSSARIRAQACHATDYASLTAVITSELEKLGGGDRCDGAHGAMD